MSFIIILILSLHSPTEDYRKIFGAHYTNAEKYLESVSNLSDSIFSNFNAEKEILEAVVFPELIRYSMVRDYLETTSLELVYLNTGKVDFSIGRFQIKPSFSEMVESYFISDSAVFNDYSNEFSYSSSNPYQIRKERINRLRSDTFQLKYLAGFYKIMLFKYPELPELSIEYFIRFISTAYNHGFEAPRAEIEDFIDKNFFPWGINKDARRYNYSNISWEYFSDRNNTGISP